MKTIHDIQLFLEKLYIQPVLMSSFNVRSKLGHIRSARHHLSTNEPDINRT